MALSAFGIFTHKIINKPSEHTTIDHWDCRMVEFFEACTHDGIRFLVRLGVGVPSSHFPH
jgi:hypothetical protein